MVKAGPFFRLLSRLGGRNYTTTHAPPHSTSLYSFDPAVFQFTSVSPSASLFRAQLRFHGCVPGFRPLTVTLRGCG